MSSIDETRAFMPLNIAVLTISDTRSLEDDKSGTTLAERLVAAGHTLAAREIIVDDVDAIRIIIKRWIADAGVDVVITTGGTGFTGRDVTPEAIEPLFEKRMDGFSIAFHMLSHAKIGTSTIQSRATAGVAGATFIFCLPGSPGACRDGWDGILAAQLDYRTQAVQLRRDHAAAGRASAAPEGAGRVGLIAIPGCASWRRPGIIRHVTAFSAELEHRGYGFRARSQGLTSRNDERNHSSSSQVSPIRLWPKLRCGSVPTSTNPAS